MIIVSAFYVIAWMPIKIYYLTLIITSNLTFIESGYYAALFVAFFYVCANPFIYAIKFEPVKHVVMGLMPCKKSQQQAGAWSEMTGAGPSSSRSAQKRNWSFCIVGMCGIDFFLFLFDFCSGFDKKNSDSVRDEFCSVRFKKRGSVRIL